MINVKKTIYVLRIFDLDHFCKEHGHKLLCKKL